MEQRLSKIAQVKQREHKQTTFNCIHSVNDWLWSHSCKELVEYHQSQFHHQPHHECSQVTIAPLLILCQGWSQQREQPTNLVFQQVEWTVTSSSHPCNIGPTVHPTAYPMKNSMDPAGRPTVQPTIQTHQASPGVQTPLRSEMLSSNGCHMQQLPVIWSNKLQSQRLQHNTAITSLKTFNMYKQSSKCSGVNYDCTLHKRCPIWCSGVLLVPY